MLNKIREKIKPYLEVLGLKLSKLEPKVWSLLGLFLAFLSGLSYSLPFSFSMLLGGIFLLASGFTDVIDGAVARVTGKASDKGAFLDSNLDRLSEVLVFSGIMYGKKGEPLLIILTLSLSLLVSYSRAKGEALGLKMMGVGLGERAERVILLALFSFLSPLNLQIFNLGLIVIILLSSFTFVQRIIYGIKNLS